MQPSPPLRNTRSYRAARPAAARPLPRHGRDSGGLRALASLLVIAVLAGVAVGLYERTMAGKIYPGVLLGGVDVGGLSRGDALGRLRAAHDAPAATRIRLSAAGKAWHAT